MSGPFKFGPDCQLQIPGVIDVKVTVLDSMTPALREFSASLSHMGPITIELSAARMNLSNIWRLYSAGLREHRRRRHLRRYYRIGLRRRGLDTGAAYHLARLRTPYRRIGS